MSRLKKLLSSYIKQPQYWYKNISLRHLRTRSDLKVLFIVGAPRSGTTLLHTLISAHEFCYTVPCETGLFTWQNLYDRPRLELSLEETHQRLNDSKDIVEFLQEFARGLTDHAGDKFFVEKTPQHVNHIAKLKRHFPNAKFVHIHRDARDCYLSTFSVDNMTTFHDAAFFAHYWNQCVASGLKMKEDDSVYTLSYEALVSNPCAELGKIMGFMDLKYQQQQLDPIVYGADKRSKRKHFKRLSGPITTASVGRWKKELELPDLKKITSISNDLLIQLGYEV